jgi:hypothetical protein
MFDLYADEPTIMLYDRSALFELIQKIGPIVLRNRKRPRIGTDKTAKRAFVSFVSAVSGRFWFLIPILRLGWQAVEQVEPLAHGRAPIFGLT